MQPVVISDGPALEGAKHCLREAYRKEATFQWLLGDVHGDPAAHRKESLLLRWWSEWRFTTVRQFSYMLALPYPPGAAPAPLPRPRSREAAAPPVPARASVVARRRPRRRA